MGEDEADEEDEDAEWWLYDLRRVADDVDSLKDVLIYLLLSNAVELAELAYKLFISNWFISGLVFYFLLNWIESNLFGFFLIWTVFHTW